MFDHQPTPTGWRTLGDPAIFRQHKVAFLCSHRFPSTVLLKAHDWIRRQSLENRCVMSGFQSGIAADAWKILLVGKSPMVRVLPRGMWHRVPREARQAVDNGQLLIVSPFRDDQTKTSAELASARNLAIMNHADEIVVAHAEPGGRLAADVARYAGAVSIKGLG